jgi:KDO2-lipid IV(A) lauroyltransferase
MGMARLLLGNRFHNLAVRFPVIQRTLWLIEAGFFWLLLLLARILPADTATAAGRKLLMWIGPRQTKHRKVKENLRLAFPEKTPEEIDALATAVWGGIGALLAEYGHLEEICRRGPGERLETVVHGDIEAFRENGRAGIFVAAHLANWELCAPAVRRYTPSVTGIYTPLQNPWLDRILAKRREALGCGLVKRDESMRTLIRELQQGRSIGMVIDQRVDSGRPVPLFGIDKMTTIVPARLALRHGYELVPIRAERLQGARYRITFYPPVLPDDPEATEIEQAVQMTVKINALFEQWIRERPWDWFCSKRRFPKGAVPTAPTTGGSRAKDSR